MSGRGVRGARLVWVGLVAALLGVAGGGDADADASAPVGDRTSVELAHQRPAEAVAGDALTLETPRVP